MGTKQKNNVLEKLEKMGVAQLDAQAALGEKVRQISRELYTALPEGVYLVSIVPVFENARQEIEIRVDAPFLKHMLP